MKKEIRKILQDIDLLSPKEKKALINKLRIEVDEIDGSLTKLLKERTFLTLHLGRIKRSLGQNTYSPEREEKIISNVKATATNLFEQKILSGIFERILDESRAALRNEKLIYKK